MSRADKNMRAEYSDQAALRIVIANVFGAGNMFDKTSRAFDSNAHNDLYRIARMIGIDHDRIRKMQGDYRAMNKYTLGYKQWRKVTDHAVKRTATEIAAAMDDMKSQLPNDVPAHIAIGLLVREITAMQPEWMQLIMEDAEIKECYWEATAESR